MIVVDACSIIELFLRYHGYKDWMGKDPLFKKDWMLYHIKANLLLQENLPFLFVLEKHYNLNSMNENIFLQITFNNFRKLSLGEVVQERVQKISPIF